MIKINGIEFAFSRRIEGGCEHGWPCSNEACRGKGPGFEVYTCEKCGWDMSVPMGGGKECVEAMKTCDSRLTFHGDRCKTGKRRTATMPTKTMQVWVTRDDEDEAVYEFSQKPEYSECEELGFTWHVGADAGQMSLPDIKDIVPNRRGCWPATLTVEIDD